jgi:ribosomal protein L29
MIKFQSIHLDRVGTTSARFNNQTYELGNASPKKVAQTIISIRNGGGKTSLLALLFSLLLPDKRQFIWTRSEGRRLDDYVLDRDTSLVAARLITPTGVVVVGAYYEWRNRRRPTDNQTGPNELQRHWFVFRPHASVLDLATLPRIDDAGQLLTLRDATSALEQIARSNPQLRLTISRNQAEYAQALKSHGVDTTMLEKQLKVVGQEGNFEKMFTASSEQGFIDHLVEMLFDEDAAKSLADRIEQNALAISQAPAARLEQAFVTEVANLLDQASLAAASAKECAATAASARRDAGELRTSLANASTRHLNQESADCEKSVEAAAAASAANAKRTVLYNAGHAYQRVEALLRVDEATARLAELTEALEASRVLAQAWALADQVVAVNTAQAEVARIQTIADELERGADAQRTALDRAAAVYRAGLDAHLAADRQAVTSAEQDLVAAEISIAALEAARTAVIGQLRDSAVEIANLERTIRELEEDVAQARTRGDLTEYQTPSDGLERWSVALADARDGLDDARRVIVELETSLVVLERQTEELRAELEIRETALERARCAYESLEATRVELGMHSTIVDIVGSDAPDIWAAQGLVMESLRTRQGELEVETGTLAAERARLSRALEAISASGLLPPEPGVLDVLGVLERAGIPATTGYAYLARSVAPSHWASVLDAHPELCAGVVVDTSDLVATRDALSGLAPTGVVVVGSKDAVADLTGDHDHVVVGPLAAAYDAEAAPALRTNFESRLDEVATRHHQVRIEHAALRDLADRLRDFYEQAPSRSDLGLLAHFATAAREDRDAAATALERTLAERTAASASLTTVRQRAEACVTLMNHDERIIERLTALVARVADRDAIDEILRTAQSVNSQRTTEETALSAQRRTAEAARVDAVDRLVVSRRDIDHFTRERHLVGDGAVADTPIVDLADQRRVWVKATDEHLRAVTNTQLDAQLDATRTQLAAERSRLEANDPDVVSSARRLVVETPSATDHLIRQARHREAHVHLEQCLMRRDSAQRHFDEWSELLAQRPVVNGVGSDIPALTDPDEAARLADERHEEELRTRAENDAAEKRRDELNQSAAAHAAAAERLGAEVGSLEAVGVLVVEGTTTPFTGTPVEASAAVKDAIRELRRAEEEEIRSAATHRGICQAVRDLVVEPRYKGLKVGLTMSHATLSASVLANAAEAARLAGEWRDRATEIAGELERTAQHRQVCIEDLAGVVERLLGELARAENVSKMPAGLGDWVDQPFLRIRFTHPREDPEAFRTRLGDAIDRVVDKSTDKHPDRRVDISGYELMKSAIAAAVPKGFRSTVLKPTPDMRVDRERVTALGTWSGGERLTAAVVLFCVVANIRADRAGARDVDPGVLIIDNPLGQASLESFVRLQLRIADLLGIQIIYTSAIKDPAVLALFENMIRLANSEGDDGRSYVHDEGQTTLPARPRHLSSVRIARNAPAPALTIAARQLELLEIDDQTGA